MATQQQAEGRLSKLKLKLVDMEVIGLLFCSLCSVPSVYLFLYLFLSYYLLHGTYTYIPYYSLFCITSPSIHSVLFTVLSCITSSVYSFSTVHCTLLYCIFRLFLLYCALYSPVLHLPSISSVLCTVLISCIRTSGMKWRSWIIQKRPQCHVMRYVLCTVLLPLLMRTYCTPSVL